MELGPNGICVKASSGVLSLLVFGLCQGFNPPVQPSQAACEDAKKDHPAAPDIGFGAEKAILSSKEKKGNE